MESMMLLSILFISVDLLNGDQLALVSCSKVQIQPMLGLNSVIAQFQLKLDSVFLMPTDDQTLFVFDDSSNQFYKLTYGPVNSAILSQPLTQNMIRLKILIATTQEDEVKNMYKGNFLLKNFDVTSPIEFENAFCKLTGNFLDCYCCGNSTSINSATYRQCQSVESTNQLDYYFSTRITETGNIFGSGTAWSLDKELYVKFYSIRQSSSNAPQFALQQHDVNDGVVLTKTCTLKDLTESFCKTSLKQNTVKVKLLGFRDNIEISSKMALFDLQDYAIQLPNHCTDYSIDSDHIYVCLCAHGQPKDGNCRTNLRSCSDAQGFNPTIPVGGQIYNAPTFSANLQHDIIHEAPFYTYDSAISKDDQIISFVYREVTKPSRVPRDSRVYVFDVTISGLGGQIAPTSTTANFDYPVDMGPMTFENAHCLVRANRELTCTCCAYSSVDSICAVDPSVDLHFYSQAGSYGIVQASARAWTTKSEQATNLNIWFNVLHPSFPAQTAATYELQGNIEPSVGSYSRCTAGQICLQQIKQNTRKVWYEMAAGNEDLKGYSGNNLVMDFPIKNGMIDIASVPRSCASATLLSGRSIPTISFTDPKFSIPPYGKIERRYLVDQTNRDRYNSPRYFTLSYERIQGFASKRPPTDTFLMNLTLGGMSFNSQARSPLHANVGFEVKDDELFTFPNAFCKVMNNGKLIECSCCGEANSCETLKLSASSEVDFMFSNIIDGYGLISGSGVIRLTTQQQLILEGHTIDAMFGAPFVIVLSISGSETTKKLTECNNWTNCQIRLTSEDFLAAAILLQIKIDGLTNTLLRFDLENKKLKFDPNSCSVRDDPQKHIRACVCSKGHSDTSKCPSLNPISCESGVMNGKLVDGRICVASAILLQTKSAFKRPYAKTRFYAYFKNGNRFYSVVYSDAEDSKDIFTMKLKIGLMTSVPPTNSIGRIEINFNVPNDGVIFSAAQCLQKDENKVDCFCSPQDIPTILPTTSIPTVVKEKDPCDNETESESEEQLQLCEIWKVRTPHNLTYDHIQNDNINSTNVDRFVNETKGKIEEKMQLDSVTADDLHIVSRILVKMANVKDANSEQRKNILSLVDGALNVKSTAFEEANSNTRNRFLETIHTIAEASNEDLTYLDGEQFGLQKTSVDCQDANDGWTGIADDGQKFKETEGTNDQVASIELDKSKLCNEATSDSRGVYFVIFRSSKLFSQDDEETEGNQKRKKRSSNFQLNAEDVENSRLNVDRCKMQFHETNGIVLTSVLLDGNQTGSVNARMKFKKNFNATDLPTHSNLVVTWYDKTDWSTERQCEMREENGEFVAHCNHLTNFALLVQRSSTDPILCNNFLDRLGFWLVIASTTCLCILFTIYCTRIIPVVKNNILIRMLNNSLRPSADSFITLYVCVMLLFYLIFLIFVDESFIRSRIVCKLSAAVLYDLFLTALIVNFFQAWNLIRVCAWSSRMEYLLGILTKPQIGFPVSLFLPFLTCLIIWFTDYGFFYRGDQYCWIRPQSIIYAVLIPVSIMLFNSIITFIIFCLPCTKICGRSSSAVRMSTGSNYKRSAKLQLFIAVLFAQFVLGFPWLLQYPAMFSSKTTIWHYLFALLNGSNGIILLLMYIYGRAQAFRRIQSLNSMNSAAGASVTTD
ncbi:hypothetical protein M3Y98_01007300 [Aphelenchoides besseyi]|nr:hypothetical protein M3Y98_01007300 [Aphelenchoides besseyi]KAI6195217.1 hypothetical protein M3Y96_01207500 [Aphelenchoides besseyi]